MPVIKATGEVPPVRDRTGRFITQQLVQIIHRLADRKGLLGLHFLRHDFG